jgi:hypothetical protein
MIDILGLIAIGITSFAATNIDDIFLWSTWHSTDSDRSKEVSNVQKEK